MKSEFKVSYRITNAFTYNDKETWERRWWVSAIRQSKYPVSNLTNFWFSEDEFMDIFSDYYDKNEFGFGLNWLYFQTNREINEDIIDISKNKYE